MRVHHDGGTESGIGDGVEGARGEGSNGERNEAESKSALEGPVVRALGGVRLGDGGGVVNYHISVSTCPSPS